MAGVLDGPAARVLDAKVSSDHSDDELQEPPMVLLDGDALQLEGTLKVATFGREGAEPAHDEDDDTEDGEHEQVLAAGVDESGATVKDSDDSDAEYQEVLDDGSPSGRKAQGLRDTIRQQSLLAKIEQFVGFAQVFSLLQHPVVRLVDRHGQSKWPLEFRQWVTDWMGHFLHALAPDPSFLFPHIDPNYKVRALITNLTPLCTARGRYGFHGWRVESLGDVLTDMFNTMLAVNLWSDSSHPLDTRHAYLARLFARLNSVTRGCSV